METLPENAPEPPAGQVRAGWACTILGLVVIVVAVLRVSSVAYGTTPKRRFAERRSYDMIKTDVHRVLPSSIIIALAGAGLAWYGGRLRGAGSTPPE